MGERPLPRPKESCAVNCWGPYLLTPRIISVKTSNIRLYFGYPLEREREKPTTLDFAQQLGVQCFFCAICALGGCTRVSGSFGLPLSLRLGAPKVANVHWTPPSSYIHVMHHGWMNPYNG
jgi:hypothetical protein